MDYTKRIAKSRPGLSQEEALESLQSHPHFQSGTKILSFSQEDDRWVATLGIPKQADGPPPFGPPEDDEKPKAPEADGDDDDDDDDDDDESSESPLEEALEGEKDEKPEEKKDEGGSELKEVKQMLEKLLDALGLSEDLEGPGAEEEGGPLDGPPGPPPLDGPPAPPPPKPKEDKPLKPGDLPPGATPVGAPAFSSVQKMAKQFASLTVETDENLTIKEAKADLERLFSPSYKVRQIERNGGKLRALISAR